MERPFLCHFSLPFHFRLTPNIRQNKALHFTLFQSSRKMTEMMILSNEGANVSECERFLQICKKYLQKKEEYVK